jgi:hypothetical protein
MQQLAPLAFNLDAVRRSVEQLAAKHDTLADLTKVATGYSLQNELPF